MWAVRMQPPDQPSTARLQGAAQPSLELTSVNLLTWGISLSEATQATVGALLRPCGQAYVTTGKSQKATLTSGTVRGSISAHPADTRPWVPPQHGKPGVAHSALPILEDGRSLCVPVCVALKSVRPALGNQLAGVLKVLSHLSSPQTLFSGHVF